MKSRIEIILDNTPFQEQEEIGGYKVNESGRYKGKKLGIFKRCRRTGKAGAILTGKPLLYQ